MRENHILIIDDDLMLLKTAEEILSDQYNVSVAKSGIQALNLLNKNIIPDLILLDIDMPQMDGYETLEGGKASPPHRDHTVLLRFRQSPWYRYIPADR